MQDHDKIWDSDWREWAIGPLPDDTYDDAYANIRTLAESIKKYRNSLSDYGNKNIQIADSILNSISNSSKVITELDSALHSCHEAIDELDSALYNNRN